MQPTEQTKPEPGDSPARDDSQPATAAPVTDGPAQQDDTLADQLSHATATPAQSPATDAEPVATPPGDRDSTGLTPDRRDTREHGDTAEPVAGVDLDLARAIVAHSSRDREWTHSTPTAAHAAMADAASRQRQRPVTPAEISANIFHERAATAQMWDDAVTHAPEQHRRHTP